MVKLSRVGGLGLLCAVAGLLACMPRAYGQSQGFTWEPEDPPYEGYPQIGMGVAVSGRTAAIGAPDYWFFAGDDSPDPLWQGLVNVYTTDAERTQWTLLTVLHLDDGAPGDRAFGKAIAMEGRRLVIASDASLHIYERRHGSYELVDTVVLNDATIPEGTALRFVGDLLAVSVANNANNGSSLRLYRIDAAGKARKIANLRPPPDFDFAGVSLDANVRALAVGLSSRTGARGRVYVYEPCSRGIWRRTSSVRAPDATAAGFGSSVALRGKRLVVGAPWEGESSHDNLTDFAGAVHVYRRAHDGWVRVQRLATNEPGVQGGLVGFGTAIVTNGRYVWITAPYANDQFASTLQNGPASLYRWSGGHLEYVARGWNSFPVGGIDMSRRYVIEGDIYGSIHNVEGAHIVDLGTLVPADGADGDDAAASTPED
jgi:hypothetical protein